MTASQSMAAPSRLESLHGIGPRLAQAIRSAFGDEERFFAAAQRIDLQALQAVEGITPKRAVDIVRQVRGDAMADGFLATPGAQRIHDDIMQRISGYAGTRHGRNRLALLGPAPDAAAAEKRIAHVLAQKARVAALDRDHVTAALRRLKPLTDPTPVCDTTTLVIAGSDAAWERLHKLGVGRWCRLGTPREADAADADLVVHAYDDGAIDFEADVEVAANGRLADIAPAALLAWARHNEATLIACQELAAAFERPSAAPAVLEALHVKGTPPDDKAVHAAIAAERRRVEADLDDRLRTVQVTATDVLRARGSDGLPAPVQKAFDAVLAEARKRLRAATGMDLQPFTATLPVGIDDEAVADALDRRRSEARANAFGALQQAARMVAKHQETLRAEVASWFETDAELALGWFAADYDLQAPAFGQRLAVTGSVHLDLACDGDAQRIDYHIGGDHRAAVLTGANSGGKTTLLEHLAQVAIMARLGLPVVGQATVPWFDEVHLVAPRRGLDAGAFETFLRGFLPIAVGDARRLVLADEVESVTEPEAAGRILAFFLDRLADSQSLCILVTHMAEAILRHTRRAPRVDGIEATGLDAEHRLVADRCPRIGHLARSTPELIVRRVVATSRGPEQALFEALQARLQEPTNP